MNCLGVLLDVTSSIMVRIARLNSLCDRWKENSNLSLRFRLHLSFQTPETWFQSIALEVESRRDNEHGGTIDYYP